MLPPRVIRGESGEGLKPRKDMRVSAPQLRVSMAGRAE
jgi:hypothetical protein